VLARFRALADVDGDGEAEVGDVEVESDVERGAEADVELMNCPLSQFRLYIAFSSSSNCSSRCVIRACRAS